MYKKFKLKNGLQVILSPLKETKAVTVLVLLPVGSRYESKDINGVSHFIEHLMFKGTKKRPTSLDISKELDAVGAEFNAFTAKDHTGYYIKVSADKIELAFDILSDMLFNSIFDETEINKERGVIVEEINMYQDNPIMYIQDVLEQTVFGPNHVLGQLISGPREVIRKVSRKKILDYKNKFYHSSNMILSVAGNINEPKVRELTEKYFGADQKKVKKVFFTSTRLKQQKSSLTMLYKKTEQVNLCLGFPGLALSDPKMYPLYILAVVLGGNMSSRLFVTIREKHSLAYFIRCGINAYQDTGVFYIQAGLDKTRIKQAVSLILNELKKIKTDGIDKKELKMAQDFLKGKLILDLEDSESVADWFGKQQLLLDKTSTPEERIKKIMAVEAGDVKKIAQAIFNSKQTNLALIGPYKDRQEFAKLLKL